MTPHQTIDSATTESSQVDTRFIYERLRLAAIGDLVTYAELSDIIALDVQAKGRGNMESARRMALRIDRIVFGVVVNVGLKRLNDIEIVATGDDATGRIRRLSHRALRKITAVQDFGAMPNDARIRHNTYASIFGAIAHATQNAAVKRVEAAVGDAYAKAKLPLERTLEAFRG